ncbi:Leucine-, isoleucine-, valine-, threonine-, and alanine-binding protein [Roseomonas mucosa]|jgi:branched-chain amino acid transport system substrate-binding protein|uniref:Leucine-, isoleucine-, valine-, threonine-, and alanine-binding protein n=1 Tax=Roseomonas mucosa TaxID=207340 RepID=A0A4Y1N4J6_9PROT|nr:MULTISPECIES: ABC transporter substrate-binding protein [Roseomonas]ATR22422.1 amino acid ABC transporter substrate-binding protein [Roseomonas sp. FDAARGOS_362]AWV24724.1 Leucine-, isoleucine-, valine-, threonine-, and alanine-binding protein [Roseomonas mucosa]MDT8276795.1 ABC transporter substrate-binding protein [Roseomonas mucosa]MDT8353853.1 ABC transporter substrate-binding protein [Roseomonas mucosa]QDJ11555.1 Leucine-, isoleucine-, valine-, threonine-, and alanine-binding protein [
MLTRRAALRASALGAALGSASLPLVNIRRAHAAEEVVIGAVYPLTGNSAQIGQDAKAVMEVGTEIINGQHDRVPMLLGEGGGLPKLGGAKLRLVFADHQNDPQKARAEAERLITQEKVALIIGSFSSATAATISQVTERYQIPYVSADNSSPSLTQRGLQWFFRPSPNDVTFTEAMFDFFKETGEKTGRKVGSISLFYEDSIFGTDSATIQRKMAEQAGIKVLADIKYRANSPSLAAEAQRLKAADADVLMPSSYTSDAILILRAMNEIGYKPKAIMAQAAGFQEQAFLAGVGAMAEGVLSRSSFAIDAGSSRPAIEKINALYKARQNKDLNDNTAREFTALQVAADAINRAGSTRAADLQKAFQATDIAGDQTIMPWKGVKFDKAGNNLLGTPVIQQVTKGSYRTVWPSDVASVPLVWNVGQ